MSDGELHEGSIWEAALLIGSLKLKNITLIIDNNDLQSSTKSTDTHPSLYPIGEKFKSFGWSTVDCNGNSNSEIFKAIAKDNNNKPKAIIAKTMKRFSNKFYERYTYVALQIAK